VREFEKYAGREAWVFRFTFGVGAIFNIAPTPMMMNQFDSSEA